MKPILISVLLLILAAAARGQIVVTPPQPPTNGVGGKVQLTAGTVVCTLQGDVPPTMGVQVACVVNAVAITPYYVKINLDSGYTLNHVHNPGNPPTGNLDAVTCLISAGGTAGVIKFDCATLTNGMESHAAGTL